MQQLYIPPLSKTNKFIIGVYAGLFILGSILAQAGSVKLVSLLGLSAFGMKSGYIYQILTFPFVEQGFTAVLFSGLLFWFIGGDLEQKWGTRFYLKFLAICTYGSGVFYLILSMFAGATTEFVPLFGITGATLAMLVAYGIIYSDRPMLFMLIFPMKAKYFCLLLAGVQLYMAVFSNFGHAAWSHIVSMLIAYGYLNYKSLRAKGWSYQQYKAQKHRENMKKKLSVVQNEKPVDKADPDKPKYWQ